MEGHGFLTFWGFSPSLDLQQEFDDTEEIQNERNVLLMGSGDIRHIFKTIAQAHRYPIRLLNLYIIEGSLESFARNMLFLKLICEPINQIGIKERAEMFLEIFGNAHIRPITARYLKKAAMEFILMITNLDYQNEKLPFLDLTHLRFKERDSMEGTFKIWKNQKSLDLHTCWDIRLRKFLALQYDSREGAFDWDYNMKLIERGGEIIHTLEYKKWRRSGLAFELRDADYSIPNYTLLSPIIINDLDGEKHPRLGYWGDIVVGPFLSFGLECEDKSFFNKENRTYTKKSQDISLRNVMALFYELYLHKKYEEAKNEDLTRVNFDIADEINKFVKITFLPSKWAKDLSKKEKYRKFFHLGVFSNSMNHFFTPELATTFQTGAKVIIETAKFLLDVKNDNVKLFREEINKFAQEANFKSMENKDDDVFLRFINKE